MAQLLRSNDQKEWKKARVDKKQEGGLELKEIAVL